MAHEKVLPDRRMRCGGIGSGRDGKRTVIESFDCSEFFEVVLHERGELHKQISTLRARDLQAPPLLICLVGSLYGEVDVLGTTHGDGGGDLSGCWMLMSIRAGW